MTGFQNQLEAIGTALLLIQKLPHTAVWALELTNDDTLRSPSVLNIFYREDEEVETLRTLLKLGQAIDIEDDFISWQQGTLYISFIKEKTNV
jgi:hypothetical protein